MLPQLQQNRSQVMCDLDAMQVHRHFDLRDDILSVEDPPSMLHIQDLDGKNVGGLPQLIPRKEKRRGLLLLHAPPFHHVCHPPQLLDAQRVKNANHIEIRVSGTKIPSRSRAVQYDAFQVRRCEFFQPVYQLPQFCIRGQHFTLLPFLPRYQLPEAPPPPLLPPPNPPNPPPPPPPPKPPPPPTPATAEASPAPAPTPRNPLRAAPQPAQEKPKQAAAARSAAARRQAR